MRPQFNTTVLPVLFMPIHLCSRARLQVYLHVNGFGGALARHLQSSDVALGQRPGDKSTAVPHGIRSRPWKSVYIVAVTPISLTCPVQLW